MPGISLLHGRNSVPTAELLDSVCFFDQYEKHTAVETGETVIGHTGYSDYPIHRFETDDAVILLEGKLYDIDDPSMLVDSVQPPLTAGRAEELGDWLHERDGDFLLVVYWKGTGNIDIFNDCLSRLPTYYATIDGTAVVSRELKFIREFALRTGSPVELDRVAAGQLLTFGYPLGDRLPFKGVRSIPPGSWVHIDEQITVSQLRQLDFSSRSSETRTVVENAENLASRFRTACRNRVEEDSPLLVSLSGGLDSRAVAATYDDIGVPFDFVTFSDSDDGLSEDARVARAIADRLGSDWELYSTSSTDAHRSKLLEMKQGMNYLGMAFILDFFTQLRTEYSSGVYVTGDGGDKTLFDLTPSKNLSSDSELARYVVDENSRLSLRDAAAVADIDAEKILDSVRQRLQEYPEPSRKDKYVHFILRERGINWLGHGEDRNRYFFWSTSPFYSAPFFDYAMSCPAEQKGARKLYAAFLEEFSSELMELNYANFGAPVDSTRFWLKRTAYDLASRYPSLRDKILQLLETDESHKRDVAQSIREKISDTNAGQLSKNAVSDISQQHGSHRLTPLLMLFTLVSLVEEQGPAQVSTPQQTVSRTQ